MFVSGLLGRLLELGARSASGSAAILTLPAPPADQRVPYGPDPLHFGDLRLPSGPAPHPVAVVVHGGFWRARYSLDHIGHLCAALTEAGVATWSVEYRRIGDPGGGWPNTLLDVGQATDYLRILAPRHNLNLARVVTLGHSAGGHLASWLAARHRIRVGDPLYTPDPLPLRAAIPLAGVVDLQRAYALRLSDGVVEDLLGGSPLTHPERYASASPIDLLPLRVRQILIHGTTDPNVPFEISQRFYDAAHARGDDVMLVPLPNVGHFEVIDPQSRVWSVVRTAVLQALF